jgi:hypothetical protein
LSLPPRRRSLPGGMFTWVRPAGDDVLAGTDEIGAFLADDIDPHELRQSLKPVIRHHLAGVAHGERQRPGAGGAVGHVEAGADGMAEAMADVKGAVGEPEAAEGRRQHHFAARLHVLPVFHRGGQILQNPPDGADAVHVGVFVVPGDRIPLHGVRQGVHPGGSRETLRRPRTRFGSRYAAAARIFTRSLTMTFRCGLRVGDDGQAGRLGARTGGRGDRDPGGQACFATPTPM